MFRNTSRQRQNRTTRHARQAMLRNITRILRSRHLNVTDTLIQHNRRTISSLSTTNQASTTQHTFTTKFFNTRLRNRTHRIHRIRHIIHGRRTAITRRHTSTNRHFMIRQHIRLHQQRPHTRQPTSLHNFRQSTANNTTTMVISRFTRNRTGHPFRRATITSITNRLGERHPRQATRTMVTVGLHTFNRGRQRQNRNRRIIRRHQRARRALRYQSQ